MADTNIEWTDVVWNPVAGCSIVSPGCHNCYAMRMAARLSAMGHAKYDGLTTHKSKRPIWTGKIATDAAALALPLKWRKPRRVFVNSMSDLFHEKVSDKFVRQVFAVMSLCGQHTFQILTKRAERMRDWFADRQNSLSECQAELVADERWTELRADETPTGKSRVRDTRAWHKRPKGR